MNDTLRGITAKYDPAVAPQADTTVLLLGILLGIAGFAAVALLLYLATRLSLRFDKEPHAPGPVTRAANSNRKSPRVPR